MQLPFLLPAVLDLAFNQTATRETTSADPPCPYLGQIYPPPTEVKASPLWHEAVSTLTHVLTTSPELQQTDASYAIQVVSLHDESPLYEYYYKAPDHEHGQDGASPIDGDSIFRIGSVSKLFPVYALLRQCGFDCFNDPITKYIPELRSRSVYDRTLDIDWNEITLGTLSSQLSGIGRDYALFDFATIPVVQPGTQFGLPDPKGLEPGAVPTCGVDPSTPPCSREESIKRISQAAPTFPSWYTPSYSNMAFQLLAYALQNITGHSFEHDLDDLIAKPLSLKRTTAMLPKKQEDSIVIPNDPYYKWDLGGETPTGGIYTSTNDLSKFALAILNHTHLSPAQTRRWLRPTSHTSNLQLSFGSPWEIYRVRGLSTYHNIDLYSKGGNLVTYTSQFILIPELDVAVVVNTVTAAPLVSAQTFTQLAIQYTLKPLFDIAKASTLRQLGGTYISTKDGLQSKFTVATDDEVGLVVTEWLNNGKDILLMLSILNPLNPQKPVVRLFPTSLKSDVKGGKSKLAFRASLLGTGPACVSWGTVGALRWAGISMDLVVFEIDEDDNGHANAVELPALRTRLEKLKTSSLNVQ